MIVLLQNEIEGSVECTPIFSAFATWVFYGSMIWIILLHNGS